MDQQFVNIRIEKDIKLSDSQREHIISVIESKNLFSNIQSFENSIISKYIVDDNVEILCIRNIIDPNDETVQYVAFNQNIVDGKVICTFVDIDIEDIDDQFYDKFVFNEIIIEIQGNKFIFEISYDKDKHPRYMATLFVKFFDKMFDEYIYLISRSL